MTVENRFDDFERQIKREFLLFNQEVSSQLSQFITTEMIDWPALQINFRPLVQNFASQMVNVMILGSNLSASEASEKLDQALSFNAADPLAATTFAELHNRVVSQLVQQQNEAIFEMRRAAEQIVPIRSVKQVKLGLTLTGRQNKAIARYRSLLEVGSAEALQRQLRDRRFDPTVRRAILGEVELTADQIDKMVERYAQRQLNFRANTIAATEAVRIANESDNLFWRQAVENEQVDEQQVSRKWITSKDEKVRSSHRFAGRQPPVDLNEPFITGDGNSLRFPGDSRAPGSDTINCRCWVRTDLVEIAEQLPQAAVV